MNENSFKPIKDKPKWLFNQVAQCAVKVNADGETIRTVRTRSSQIQEVMEAINLAERDIEGEA